MPATKPLPVTLINILSVEPARQQELVRLLRENTETIIRTLNGWIATELIASADGTQVVIHSQWQSAADLEAMRTDPRMRAYFPRIMEFAKITSVVGTSVMSHHC